MGFSLEKVKEFFKIRRRGMKRIFGLVFLVMVAGMLGEKKWSLI
jgi:hypothetical protein